MQTKKRLESFQGVNRSLEQSVGELRSCKLAWK